MRRRSPPPAIAAFLVGGGIVFALEHDSGSSARGGNSPAAFGGPQGDLAGSGR